MKPNRCHFIVSSERDLVAWAPQAECSTTRRDHTRSSLWALALSLVLTLSCILPVQAVAQSITFSDIGRPAPELNSGQSATLLPDGRWLILGGQGEDGPLATAFIRDLRKDQIIPLATGLLQPRAWHTATLLPDGNVLILGGIGSDGYTVRSAELYHPQTQTFEALLEDPGLIPRARHTATLLTEGRLLITGGVTDRGETLHEAELWNPRTLTPEPFNAKLVTARSGHLAALLPAEPVLLWGGNDRAGEKLEDAELYLPQEERFTPLTQESAVWLPAQPLFAGLPEIEATLPKHEAFDVQIDSLIAVRFSKPLQVDTLNSNTATLVGPAGAVAVLVVPAEGGLLLFVTPRAQLLPAAKYTLFINGATDDASSPLPFSAVSFTTQSLEAPARETTNSPNQSTASRAEPTPTAVQPKPGQQQAGSDESSAADEAWIPGPKNFTGDWRSGRAASPLQQLPPLQAAPGVTALAGQVLTLNGNALPNVTLTVGNKTVQTDATGRFLMPDIAAGPQVLVIDGSSANKPGKTYGLFEAKVAVAADRTNALGYTIWMPLIDTAHASSISSPTVSETVLTTPRIPGLELHIPPDVVIRDRAGQIVTEVSITPIPVDRPPFPLPSSLVPVYFTIQPGGAYLHGLNPQASAGARLIYPNFSHEAPGSRIDFWNYDPEGKGWYVYGQGTVSADGQQVIPDPGVAIYEFTGAMVSLPSNAPAEGPPPSGCRPTNPIGGGGDCKAEGPAPAECPGEAGDPVDCYTGLFIHERTDLYLTDTLPIEVKRTYRPRDNRSRSFGIGTNLGYDMFMVGDTSPYTYQELILPDGARIRFNRISPGLSFIDAVYEHTQSATRFYGARLEVTLGPSAAIWKMTLKDGTILWFPDSDSSPNPRSAALVGLQDRYGNILNFTRDAAHNLTRITSTNGRYVDFTYDASNRITQARDHLGRTVGYAYDATGRLISATDPLGNVEQYTYDSADRMLTVKKPNGNIMVTNVYDANGRVSQQTLADGGIYQFAYTLANGQVTQTDVTDPRGNIRRMAFNSSGYVSSLTRALGKPEQQITVYERDPVTRLLLSVTDPLGRKTAYTYDAKGNRTSVTHLADTPQAVTESYAYEPQFSQLVTITDPLNHLTSLLRDDQGNVVSITDPLNNVSQLRYNAAGQVIAITNPLNQTIQLNYDAGDLVSITDPLGRSVTRYFDGAGRLLSVIDPLGNVTRTDYDAIDRPTQVIDPLGGITSMVYDVNSNLLSVTDPKLGKTSYTYDTKDRVATRTDPLLKAESYLYDGLDNRIRLTDRKGKIATFTYDALNRLTKAEYGRGKKGQNLTAPDATVTYVWDAGDRLTQLADSQGGTVTRGYDGLDRLTAENTPQGSVSYGWDAAGRRTTLTVAGQPQVSYGYDDADRLTTITQGTSQVGFTYDDAGRRATLTLPNGIVATYSYDNANQLTAITYNQGATLIGDLAYSYDVAGRRTQIGGSLARTNLPSALTSATYDAANRLTNWAGTAQSYDANGNLTGDGAKTYTWDSRNRLTGLSGAAAASFQYDGLGRRTGKTVFGTTTNFLYDGLNPVQELTGTTPKANLLTGLGIDEYFARTDSAGTRSFVADALGSTLALTDDAGAMQTSYTYAPYGETTASGAASGNALQYTGRENDGTGLYYYRARYYDPVKGRFVSEDPIGLAGGINTYAYAGEDPLSYIDPLGLTVTFTGNAATQGALKAAYQSVRSTQFGANLINQMESSSINFTITNQQNGNAYYNPRTNTISVDPNFHPTTNVDTGSSCAVQPAPTNAILGHEIGHAITGALDDGPGNMNNVNKNENPIRKQLGLPRRTSY